MNFYLISSSDVTNSACFVMMNLSRPPEGPPDEDEVFKGSRGASDEDEVFKGRQGPDGELMNLSSSLSL